MFASSRPKRRKIVLLSMLILLVAGVGVGIVQRQSLLARYYTYRLERVPNEQRGEWIEKLVALGEPAVPCLLGCFQKDDQELCEATRSGLERLLADWGSKDARSATLANYYFDLHAGFSPAGQTAALQMLPEILATGVEAAARARTVVTAALKDRSAEQRYLGITVAIRPELNLLASVVPLLDDPDARVRRMAMRALGPLPTSQSGTENPVVDTDDLLRCLHDPDAEVRRLCEMYLTKNRGRSERDLRLSRLLTHPDPMKRLQLLVALPEEDDLDIGPWLNRLSKDSESAVRAGAVRAAAENRIDFADRLDQMRQSDTDGTVRKIAEHYRKMYR